MRKCGRKVWFHILEENFTDVPDALLRGVKDRCMVFVLGAIIFFAASVTLPVFLASACLAALAVFLVEALPFILAVLFRNYTVLADAKILTGTDIQTRFWKKKTKEILFIDQKTDLIYSMQVPRKWDRYAEGMLFSCVLTKTYVDGSGICHVARFLAFHPTGRERKEKEDG